MFDLFLSISSDAVLVFDAKGNILRVNDAAAHMFGYTVDELIHKPLSLMLPERHVEHHAELFEGFLLDQDATRKMRANRQIIAKHKDGSEFPVEISVGKGNVDGQMILVAILKNVVAKTLSEEILGSIANLVLVANSRAEIVYISPSVRQIIGYEPDEILGDGWWEMERISGGDVEMEKDYIRRAAAGLASADTKPYEHRVRHKDGSWRWLMLADTKGPRDLVIGIGTDITDLKRTEEDLQHQRDLLQALMDNLPDTIYFKDMASRFTLVNQAQAQMMGVLNPEEIIGKTDADFQDPNLANSFMVEEQAMLRSGEPVLDRLEYNPARDGKPRWLSATKVPLRDQAGEIIGLVGVSRDITERILTENQLRQTEESLRRYAQEIAQTNRDLAEARDRALEASYLKSAFLATVSHEIRTPMNAILGMGELLLDTELDREQREFAGIIDSSARNLLSILNDILEFSKIEAGKLLIHPMPFNPAAVAQETIKLFQQKAHTKHISLDLIIASTVPEILAGDGSRIRQILGNLVSNAIKFTENGGQVSIHLSGTQVNGDTIMVTFSVQDNGIGIPEQIRPNLFEPFTQADVSVTRRHGGTGLGLAISRRLVDMMNGEMGFESIEGAGSTFWFTLPLGKDLSRIESEKKLGDDKLPTEKQYEDFSGGKPVLVVEDNLVNRDLFAMQLSEFGLYTRVASNGEEAVELIQSDPDAFSLVLMDLHMPKMDGMTATQIIRQGEINTNRHIIIIAVTADAMLGSEELCLEAGMDDFITKPARLVDINNVLVKWLKAP